MENQDQSNDQRTRLDVGDLNSPAGGGRPPTLSAYDFKPPPAAIDGSRRLLGLSLGLLVVAAGAGIYQFYLPLRAQAERDALELARAKVELGALHEKIAGLEAATSELQASQAELSVAVQLREQALAELTKAKEELGQRLEEEIKKGDILVKERGGELVVDVSDKILFDSGEALLNEQGKGVLKRVGEIFAKSGDKIIQVGGHTDDVPISPKLVTQFPSNWELSTARANNVVRFLQDEAKIPGKRLVATGFSQYRPVASNATKIGRQKNRRIEVVLLPTPPKN